MSNFATSAQAAISRFVKNRGTSVTLYRGAVDTHGPKAAIPPGAPGGVTVQGLWGRARDLALVEDRTGLMFGGAEAGPKAVQRGFTIPALDLAETPSIEDRIVDSLGQTWAVIRVVTKFVGELPVKYVLVLEEI